MTGNENGYHVTEITALSQQSRPPVSMYSHIHSSQEEKYKSVNDITFQTLAAAFGVLPQATYIFDRGYDMNKLLDFMHEHANGLLCALRTGEICTLKESASRPPPSGRDIKASSSAACFSMVNTQNAGLLV
ncbi:MAG: hypothetical protein ACOX58_10730 [Christensenellales bacterium]|jgi:hypothetical protein